MLKPSILFCQSHEELIQKENSEFSSLFEFLNKSYECVFCEHDLESQELRDYDILVLGAPTTLKTEEIEFIKQYLQAGGGLFLVSNADIGYCSPEGLEQLLEMVGIQIQEYLNYPPTSLRVFQPHFITANLQKIRVGKLAHLTLSNPNTLPLAFTKATHQPIIACSRLGAGRIVVMGDSQLFANELIQHDDNQTLANNLFSWLAATHSIEIEAVKVAETVKWGHSDSVELKVKNVSDQVHAYIRCILQSDSGAFIEEPSQEIYDAPRDTEGTMTDTR